MKQKVEIFQAEDAGVLQYKINKFAETHHIENISYSVSGELAHEWHYCAVVYTDK